MQPIVNRLRCWLRMSDLTSTPSASNASQAPNKPSTPNQQSRVNQLTSGEEVKDDGRRRWEGGSSEAGSLQNNADEYSDYGSNNRKGKRPEVQHYKPPGASRKPDESHHAPAQEYNVNNHDEVSKAAGGAGGSRRSYRGRGKRGGHSFHNQQHHSNIYGSPQNDVENTSRKVKSLSIEEEYIHYKDNVESFHKGGYGGKRKKKPEQLHYIPKKAGPGNEVSGVPLEGHTGKDVAITGTKKEDDKEEAIKQLPRCKDHNPYLPGKDGVVNNKDENVPKEEKFGTGKRNRSKINKKDSKKDNKDDSGNFGQTQDKRIEKKESGSKITNQQSNKGIRNEVKQNGYFITNADHVTDESRHIGGRAENESHKKVSAGPGTSTSGNESNLPPRLRGSERYERPKMIESGDRGGRTGGRGGKGGSAKAGRWVVKHSRGNSPQGETTSLKNDPDNQGNKTSNAKREEPKTKNEIIHKSQGNKQHFDSKGITSKNTTQSAATNSPRAPKSERDKGGRLNFQGIKTSLSVSSDISRSSESFHQQHTDDQTEQNRNKRNSNSYRGVGQSFKTQSPSPNANNQQHIVTPHNKKSQSPNHNSPNQARNPHEGNEIGSRRNEPSFYRNRGGGINANDNQPGGYRRSGHANRNSKDMSDWRYYREGSYQSVSSDYDNQYQQDSRGRYYRGGYEDDRSWDAANLINSGNQIQQSHRDYDLRERISGGSHGRQTIGRSNSGVFGGNNSNIKHSTSVPRTSIPPRFQRTRDSGYLVQDKGDQPYQPQKDDKNIMKHTELNIHENLNSESDWGSWRGQVVSHDQIMSDESKESDIIDKKTAPQIANVFQKDSLEAESSHRLNDPSKGDQVPTSSLGKQVSTTGDKERIDAFTSDDFSSYSKVTDWSLEVEEEEQQQREQLLHQKQAMYEHKKNNTEKYSTSQYTVNQVNENSPQQHSNQGPNSGGLIRLPPPHSSSSSSSSNWRRDQVQQHGQQNHDAHSGHPHHPHAADNQSHMLHDSNNPAWRGISNPEVLQLQQQQQIAAAIAARAAANAANRAGGNQNQYSGPQARYLFDHKNPNKPIHVGGSLNNAAVGNPRLISNSGDSGIISGARFALDPRFVHPARAAVRHPSASHDGSSHQSMTQQHQYTQAYHPVTGQPLPIPIQQQGNYPSSYRPPFPNSCGGTGPRNSTSVITGPPPAVAQAAQLHSKQGSIEGNRHEWQHGHEQHPISSSLPQMMHMENKPDFETIKYNEMALFETSKLIATNDFLSQGGQNLRRLWDTKVAEARRNILIAFQRLLQNDLVFCAEKDVEFLIWRICFYNLVETLKSLLKHSEQSLTALGGGCVVSPIGPCLTLEAKSIIENIIRCLLDEGLEFYSYMLDTLDKTYNIGLDQYYDVLEPRCPDANMRCVLVSAQKCLLCLGDLARYKEQTQETSNYGKARQYYQKASHIDTRNGRPYNQLAILAYTTKRKFEAVYYNMRCLSCKSSVRSSQESLTVIFEDVAKKWESSEKKRLEDKEERKREAEREIESSRLIKGTSLR